MPGAPLRTMWNYENADDINDLVPVKEETITAPALQRTNTGKLKMSKSFSVSSEINLLGCTVDEAIAKLDKYLDDAYLAHLPSVRVVHGKGTGACAVPYSLT
jgi:DNA mismatch repair protein MutS2